MSIKESYTGKVRTREEKVLFSTSLVVLQIEIRRFGTYYDNNDPRDIYGMDIDTTFWRDATPDDFMNLNIRMEIIND